MVDADRLQQEVDLVYGRELQRELEDPERLRELYGAPWVDGPFRQRAKNISELAASMLKAEIAEVNLISDTERLCIASAGSLAGDFEGSMPVQETYCQHVIATKKLVVIADAIIHRLVRDNPNASVVRSYLGIPLTHHGRVIGTLCVAAREPREWTPMEVHMLTQLAASLLAHPGWEP